MEPSPSSPTLEGSPSSPQASTLATTQLSLHLHSTTTTIEVSPNTTAESHGPLRSKRSPWAPRNSSSVTITFELPLNPADLKNSLRSQRNYWGSSKPPRASRTNDSEFDWVDEGEKLDRERRIFELLQALEPAFQYHTNHVRSPRGNADMYQQQDVENRTPKAPNSTDSSPLQPVGLIMAVQTSAPATAQPSPSPQASTHTFSEDQASDTPTRQELLESKIAPYSATTMATTPSTTGIAPYSAATMANAPSGTRISSHSTSTMATPTGSVSHHRG
ncbi:hypothetical protein FRC00_012656 [Tulasnella sp. 408]|nr:hypothetical protein FRC00_012656 [Tulasnella sp. 408]